MKGFRIILSTVLLTLAISCTSTKNIPAMIYDGDGSVDLLLPDKSRNSDPRGTATAQKFRTPAKKQDGDSFLMDATTDENGETQIRDSIVATTVTAKFMNTSERMGMVDIAFYIKTPAEFVQSGSQVRLTPRLTVLQDTLSLDGVYLTGDGYRAWQEDGYERYAAYLETIESDTTVFIRKGLLDRFLERNHPQSFAAREADPEYYADTLGHGRYGVTALEASDHYVRRWSRIRNQRRMEMSDEMRERLIPEPIVSEGIRLDSVFRDAEGDIYYLYEYSIRTRPKMKRLEVSLEGEIHDTYGEAYGIEPPEPLTFYISSIASLVRDETYKYKVSRNVDFKVTSRIQFESGSTEVDLGLGRNSSEVSAAKSRLSELFGMDGLAVDDVTLRAFASPEGTVQSNRALTDGRVASVRDIFQKDFPGVKFRLESGGENWDMLDSLVKSDRSISYEDRAFYAQNRRTADADKREAALKSRKCYSHLKEDLYPQLRVVTFDCRLHRTEISEEQGFNYVTDAAYEAGLQALKDMDYETAAEILKPYKDYNAALALIGAFKNYTALQILGSLDSAADVDYLKTIVYVRLNKFDQAERYYRSACRKNRFYISRGNLDPDIAGFKKAAGIDDDALYAAAQD